MSKKKVTLTAKQKAFVDHYAVLLNASEAARKAGYSKKTARQMGYENLTKPYIVEAINEKMNELGAMPEAEILMRLTQQGRFDISLLIDSSGYFRPGAWEKYGHMIKSIRFTKDGVQITPHDGQDAIVMLGKNRAMWTEVIDDKRLRKIEVTIKDNDSSD